MLGTGLTFYVVSSQIVMSNLQIKVTGLEKNYIQRQGTIQASYAILQQLLSMC